MNDTLIREHFHRQVLKRHHASPQTLVLNELGLKHGRCRADIAIINGSLTGYEIKSDDDSLERLAEQIKSYSAVFDRATVITGTKHRAGAVALLPKWWGVVVCREGRRGGIKFETWRSAGWNKKVDPIALAQLLWKSEVLEILHDLGDLATRSRQPRSRLYERLVEVLDLPRLQNRVRECLKKRKNWRHPEPLSPSGD